jgi:hypothetical protein
MPIITSWFPTAVELPWEIAHESPWSEKQGMPFRTFPLGWLVPYATPRPEDLCDQSRPIWITEIHPSCELGHIVSDQEGSFVIHLPSTKEAYMELLADRDRKRFLDVLKKNQDLTVVEQQRSDIEYLWGHYVDRLQLLAMRAGGDPYTEEDLAWRYQFLHQESIRTLSFYQGDTLVAVNIALVKENTVYDLACIINPLPDALKRSLGTVAILKNIAWSIEHGFAQYDLLSRDYGYKRQFGATEMKLKALIMGDESFFETYQIPDSLRWRV